MGFRFGRRTRPSCGLQERREEEGLHVHAFRADGTELYNGTYSEVTIDGITLNEEHIRYYMAQSVLPYLKGRVQSISCPQCATLHFASSYDALKPRSMHTCQNCGHSYNTPGRKRLIVTNPFVTVKDELLSGKSVQIRRDQ